MFADISTSPIGTFNPCTGYNVVIGDVSTIELTMNDHVIVQVDDGY
jgi:hypothetical protein